MSDKMYKKLSKQGIAHVKKNYNFEDYETGWVEVMDDLIERHGSWENRQGYEPWHLLEVA